MYLMWDAVLGVYFIASNNPLFRLTLEVGIFPEKINKLHNKLDPVWLTKLDVFSDEDSLS
jgi:hypothetical protein